MTTRKGANMKKKEDVRTVIEQDEIPMPIEILERHIRQISEWTKKGLKAGLKEETIVILLHEHTKVGKPHIREILRALPKLAERCLQKP